MSEAECWTLIHTERARLVELLDDLDCEQWEGGTLCADWTVEQVVAHLSAAARTGRWAWIRSIVRSGFSPARHNARQLSRYLGDTAAESLEMFERSVTLSIAPTKDFAGFLGEVIVHGQDIAKPLGLPLDPDHEALLEVARFYASQDFAVNSRTLVKGLTLDADDADFRVGSGPEVRGRLLDLVMAMAGRPVFASLLEGEGAEELRARMS
ncbi:MAG: maleylpyruvate isomerase family mycothiol-dependent enzyme [Brevibacterium sp.]